MGLKEDLLFLEIDIFLFWGSSEAAMGEKTGARSARARMRGQNPLVYHIFI